MGSLDRPDTNILEEVKPDRNRQSTPDANTPNTPDTHTPIIAGRDKPDIYGPVYQTQIKQIHQMK